MRTIWRVLVRTIFWSFERGTWPYDVAVALIVIFVLLSPRSWFHDRAPAVAPPNPSMVQLEAADPSGGTQTYRVDARLLPSSLRTPESELEQELRDAVRNNVRDLPRSNFEILHIEPIRGGDGRVAYYDVSIKP